jgi:hypothetical protein
MFEVPLVSLRTYVPSRFVAQTTACGILPSWTAAARSCSNEAAAAADMFSV